MNAEMNSQQDGSAGCCHIFYEQDWVRQLALESFHPGGADLTRKMVQFMALRPGARIADLGCGVGTSAMMLAAEDGLSVRAIDFSQLNIDYAQSKLNEHDGGALDIVFQQASADQLPWDAGSLDGAIAECTLSLFQDKSAALQDIKRCLKAEAQLAITDMVIGPNLPAELRQQLAPWTCIADTLSVDGYKNLFTENGFSLLADMDESQGLYDLMAQIKRQVLLLGAGQAFGIAEASGFQLDIQTVRFWLDQIKAQVDLGNIAYHRFHLKPVE